MKKSILLFCTIISFVITCQAQKSLCTISGVVTDAEDRPVPNVAVFIPFTSNWCTTNAEGEYSLKGLQPGPIELSFRHLSFESLTKSILVQPVKNMSLNVQLKTTRIELTEVVKMASPAKQLFGLEQFTRYVLSDGYGRSCKINNPQDLEFYWEEDRLVGQASKPLEIINNYLGYNIKYYLDYFWFEEKKLLPDDPHTHILFAFSGSALYEDRLENNWMRKSGWENNRSKEFRGTLRHFLQCLYDGQLDACGYVVKEAWMNEKEFQKAKKLSPAVAYARFHEMNKLFYLNPLVTEASYLHYEPQINLMIKALKTDSGAVSPA